jgi:hypothetical protein
LGQVFSKYFGFLCHSSFHQFLHNHHHLSFGAGTIGKKWLQYQKSHPTNKKKSSTKNFQRDGESMQLVVLILARSGWEFPRPFLYLQLSFHKKSHIVGQPFKSNSQYKMVRACKL